jgi:hypothetical protein
MRKLLICGALAAAALQQAGPASAQAEGLWCLRANVGRGVGERCHFRTFESCSNERILYGSTAFCSQNPRYLPYWQGRFGEEPRQKVVRKKKKQRRH